MSCAVTSRNGLACQRPLIDCTCLLRCPSRLGQASTHRPLPQRLHDQGPGVKVPREHPRPLQIRLRDHPRPQAALQLSDIHGRPDAPGQAGEGSKESVGIILLAEARLDVDHYAAHLVHEVAVLRHQIPEAVPHLP